MASKRTKSAKSQFPRRVPHRTAQIKYKGETVKRTVHQIWEQAPGRATGKVNVEGQARKATLSGGRWSIGSVIK